MALRSEHLQKQVLRSRETGKTTPFLARLALQVVSQAVTERYTTTRSIRCLQASCGIERVLSRLGIRAHLFGDAFCIVRLFRDPRVVMWGGFWGQDHHVWVSTEFHEIVDLGVSWLHEHPKSTRNDAWPIPAIWWRDIDRLPRLFRYLPVGSLVPRLEPTEQDDLDAFLRKVDASFDDFLKRGRPGAVTYAPVIYSEESLNELLKQRNPWLSGAARIPQDMPYPPWVQAREDELMAAHYARQESPSETKQAACPNDAVDDACLIAMGDNGSYNRMNTDHTG